jgi:hypothetical protein
MGNSERENFFLYAAKMHWQQSGESGKGYVKLVCPCGQHIMWIHKTPSNPNHYRQRAQLIKRLGCKPTEGR